jgi:hypothetical protein
MAFQLQWPVASRKIIEHFLQNTEYWSSFSYAVADGSNHTYPGNIGISIEALFKEDVLACADGVVESIETPGDVRPDGNRITLKHETDSGTFFTTYCHLFSISAQVGQSVSASDVIGRANSSGSVIGSQLRLILVKEGATDAEETHYQTPDGRSITLLNDVVDPADYLVPAPQDRYAQRARAVSTTTDNVNIRRGPSTRFGVIRTAKAGDEVEVLGINNEGDWYQLKHKGNEGWASTDFVDYVGDADALPTVEYIIKVPLFKPNHPLRGMHDGEPRYPDRKSGAEWMVENGITGWAVDMVYCMGPEHLDKTYPDGAGQQHNVDYSYAEQAGVKVILRWNYSWAKSEGGGGTFGDPKNDERLIQWIARGIQNTRGVWGHIIGNEPNRAGENHDYGSVGNIGTPISPQRIARLVKGVKALVGPEHRISPPAMDGTNTEAYQAYGKAIDIPNNFFSAIIDNLEVGDIDWVAMHGYSRGSKDDPANTAKFGNAPLEWQYFGFRMWEPFAKILRDHGPDWERLPIVITETNHLKVGGSWNAHAHNGWDHSPEAAAWIRKAYDYIQEWNHADNDQFVHGLVLYRLSMDEWELENKPLLLDALKQSGESPV